MSHRPQPESDAARLSEQIEETRFTPTRLRGGYDMGQVDDVLAALAKDLSEGTGTFGTRSIDEMVLPVVRWREGYAIDQVDTLVAQVREHFVRQGAHGAARLTPGAGR